MPREQEAKASPPQHSTAAAAYEVHSRSHFPAFRRQQVENPPKVCKGKTVSLRNSVFKSGVTPVGVKVTNTVSDLVEGNQD